MAKNETYFSECHLLDPKFPRKKKSLLWSQGKSNIFRESFPEPYIHGLPESISESIFKPLYSMKQKVIKKLQTGVVKYKIK